MQVKRKNKEDEMIRAKFLVTSVNVSEGEVTLIAVACGSEENKSFFTYTPSGEIKMSIVNENTLKGFEVGKEYYVDFTKAD